ncbi:gonadal protein gdl [Eurytemora carolleeae]|uniref:gonadal protein gdl n=1 Tax=Eurytemora carolleeae TaxID=1294199 RepID=UPI000C78C51B|nr:gonadal protein gdl [Eurytemora carolleeae]|eukprot:XP_023322265.1 gonadal protein gdl-like [Eurytemora affinis]
MDNDQFEKRVRFLLHHLKKMSREMPSDLRQRVPYELLSSLAANLAQATVLAEAGFRDSAPELPKPVSNTDKTTGKYVWFGQVSDQQGTLEKAGVPGFFVSSKPVEIRVQMHLLEFILKLRSIS